MEAVARSVALLSVVALASAFHAAPSLHQLGTRAPLRCAGRKAVAGICLAKTTMQAVDDKTEVCCSDAARL